MKNQYTRWQKLAGLITESVDSNLDESISRISKSDFKNMIREMVLEEAKKDKEEEEIDVEMDAEESPIEDTPEGNPDDILDALKTALNGAKALGDEKLTDQIGNTITFYTRVHIVGQEQDNMNEDMGGDSTSLPQDIINKITTMYAEEGMDMDEIANQFPEYGGEIIDYLQGYDLGLDYDI